MDLLCSFAFAVHGLPIVTSHEDPPNRNWRREDKECGYKEILDGYTAGNRRYKGKNDLSEFKGISDC